MVSSGLVLHACIFSQLHCALIYVFQCRRKRAIWSFHLPDSLRVAFSDSELTDIKPSTGKKQTPTSNKQKFGCGCFACPWCIMCHKLTYWVNTCSTKQLLLLQTCCKLPALFDICFFVIFQSLSHELQTSKCDNGSVWHSCLFRVLIRNINSEVGSEVWVPGTDVSND